MGKSSSASPHPRSSIPVLTANTGCVGISPEQRFTAAIGTQPGPVASCRPAGREGGFRCGHRHSAAGEPRRLYVSPVHDTRSFEFGRVSTDRPTLRARYARHRWPLPSESAAAFSRVCSACTRCRRRRDQTPRRPGDVYSTKGQPVSSSRPFARKRPILGKSSDV